MCIIEMRGFEMLTGMTANIAWYFFLAGAGSGSFAVSLVVDHLLRRSGTPEGDHPSKLPLAATSLAALLVLAGSAFLFFDLGAPRDFLLVFKQLGTSILSFGALSISLFLGFCALRLVALRFAERPFARIAERLGTVGAGVFALTTAAYTGYFLFTMKSIPFWNSFFLVLLFFVASLSSGSACLLATFSLGRFEEKRLLVATACRIDTLLLCLEALALGGFLLSRLLAGDTAQTQALTYLLGPASPIFWLGVVALGLVVPLVLEKLAVSQTSDSCALMAAGAVLIGSFLLRCSIILI